jgi:hypothetical protein
LENKGRPSAADSRAQATGIDASNEAFDDRIDQRRMGNWGHVPGSDLMTACVRQLSASVEIRRRAGRGPERPAIRRVGAAMRR